MLYATEATFNSWLWDHETQCLTDTRVDLLQQIRRWSRNPSGPSILWLSGMAGTGKSTISRTVAYNWAQQKQLGGSFFLSRGRVDLSGAAKLFTTLASQLAIAVPVIKPAMSKEIMDNTDFFYWSQREQWKVLIFQPLLHIGPKLSPSQPIKLVIDALDKCEDELEIRLILQLFC